jgi:hypothetical protein
MADLSWAEAHDEARTGRRLGAAIERVSSDREKRPAVTSKLFTRHRVGDLLDLDLTSRFVVRSIWADGSYGQLVGPLKALKSYVGTILDLSIATGTPFLGRFPVDRCGPVLTYVGEGGRIPWTRRTNRIAEAMGIDLRGADYHPCFDVAPMGSERFKASLERDLAELSPVLLHIDPYYAYHGTEVDSRNLHHEGSLLSSLSSVCGEAGTSCLITNHFNQTGQGTSLARITQAGSGEWVDSWLLLSHRETPDVERGAFKLLLEVGSRQWGGSTWDLDLTIGAFDATAGAHDGAISWEIEPHTDTSRVSNLRGRILAAVRDEPWRYTRSELAGEVGGKREHALAGIDKLLADRELRTIEAPHSEGARQVRRQVFGLLLEPVPGAGNEFN